MATRFASKKRAFAFCDRCGQRCQLKVMTYTYVLGRRQNIKVCKECQDENNGDHPQYWVGIIGSQKVSNDPQALREPRPDTNRNESCSDFAFSPVATQTVNFYLNNVFVTEFTSVAPGVVIVPPVVPPAIL
jgi:hypothetical protein